MGSRKIIKKLIADSSKLRGQSLTKLEVGPVVVPGGRDYAAAKDAEVGKGNLEDWKYK